MTNSGTTKIAIKTKAITSVPEIPVEGISIILLLNNQ